MHQWEPERRTSRVLITTVFSRFVANKWRLKLWELKKKNCHKRCLFCLAIRCDILPSEVTLWGISPGNRFCPSSEVILCSCQDIKIQLLTNSVADSWRVASIINRYRTELKSTRTRKFIRFVVLSLFHKGHEHSAQSYFASHSLYIL